MRPNFWGLIFTISFCALFAKSQSQLNQFDCSLSQFSVNGGDTFNLYYEGLAKESKYRLSIQGNLAAEIRDKLDANIPQLFFIIQMQGSVCNWDNNDQYGSIKSDGTSGSYELGTVTDYVYYSTDSDFTVLYFENPILNNYKTNEADTNLGKMAFQVIWVRSTPKLRLNGNPSVPAWNGKVGGVWVSVSLEFDMQSYTIDLSDKGFAGAKSYSSNSVVESTDYVSVFGGGNGDGYKGEGICGKTAEGEGRGYPYGDLSRGAPANAGGGGNSPSGSGGGGAGAGGDGGSGLNGLNGIGGKTPSHSGDPTYAFFGGGGGAGFNEGNAANGGGIIVICTDILKSTSGAALKVNGGSASGGSISSGGAGGAGTVVLVSRLPPTDYVFKGVAIEAMGGDANDAVVNLGGAGGGGIVLTTDEVECEWYDIIDVSAGNCGDSDCIVAPAQGTIKDRILYSNFNLKYGCAISSSPPPPYIGDPLINDIDCDSSFTYTGGDYNTYLEGLTVLTQKTLLVNGDASSISAGQIALIIQMQDSECSWSDDSNYGSILPGKFGRSGAYELNTIVGVRYEAHIDTSILFFESNLKNLYINDEYTQNAGQKRFQVVLVPAYGSLTLEADMKPTPWNGLTGGVVAVVASSINMNNKRIDASSAGFRGALSVKSSGASPSTKMVSEYVVNAMNDGAKGEGICGAVDEHSSYPNGDLSRGAPHNGGGGGNHMFGGGGGGGGASGAGALGYGSSLSGGIGGAAAFSLSPSNLAFFGGGGGGSSYHNSPSPHDYANGKAGGGIVFIIADEITGNGEVLVNGASGSQAPMDGTSGFGGAGGAGTVVLVSKKLGTFSGLSISAKGGIGAFDPESSYFGGGGGGGALITTDDDTISAIDLSAGTCGRTSCPVTNRNGGSLFNVQYAALYLRYQCSAKSAPPGSDEPTPLPSTTRSHTPAISPSPSPSRDGVQQQSKSKSLTPAVSITPSVSPGASSTPTAVYFTPSITRTPSKEPSSSRPPSFTASESKSVSITATSSRSRSATKSPAPSLTPRFESSDLFE